MDYADEIKRKVEQIKFEEKLKKALHPEPIHNPIEERNREFENKMFEEKLKRKMNPGLYPPFIS